MSKIATTFTLSLVAVLGCGGEPSGPGDETPPAVSAVGSDPASVVLRRIWAGATGDFTESSPSPDGRYVTEVDWSTGDLAARELSTGALQRLTNKGPWNESQDFAEQSIFSPDGRQIAYAWFSEDVGGYQLRVLDFDGSAGGGASSSAPRVLYMGGPDVPYLCPQDWSSDGTQIVATVFRPDGAKQMVLIATADGSVRVLRAFDCLDLGTVDFSPDGQYLAYDLRPGPGSPELDIYLLAADGSGEITAVGGPGNDRLLGWAPDGRSILFHSDRSGTPGIWMMPVLNGRPSGEPELLRADVWRLSPIGFAGEAYMYGVRVEVPQIYTAVLDISAGRILVPPEPIEDLSGDEGRSGDWSPNGQYLAYVVLGQAGQHRLVIRSLAGGESRELSLDVEVAGGIRWVPDGESVLVYGSGAEGRSGLFRIDLKTGGTSAVFYVEPGQGMFQFALSPSGTTVYFRRRLDGQGGAIVARDLETGGERRIAEVQYGGSHAVSPDGRMLAFTDFDPGARIHKLMLVPAGGGETREVYSTPAPNFLMEVGGLNWTPDGRHILFVRWDEEAQARALWRISPQGRELKKLLEDRRDTAVGSRGLARVRLHPDGRRIVFRSGISRGEIWVMENIPGVSQLDGGSGSAQDSASGAG